MVLGFVAAVTTNIVGNHIYDNMTAPGSTAVVPPSPYAKDLANLVYHASVIGGLSVAYTMVLRKILKVRPADLGKLDLEDAFKVVGTIGLAMWTQDMLVKQGILPANIIKST